MAPPKELEVLLRSAGNLDFPYQFQADRQGTPAAVLILFGENEGDASILITRRTETVETHKGQMAFPGGVADPADEQDLGRVTTALRETEEEIGISRALVRVVGALPPVWTVTGFLVTPVLGILSVPLTEIDLRPNPGEIAEALWIRLETLQSPEVYRQEWMEYEGRRYLIDVFEVGPHRIWGATGRMLRNLLDRIERIAPYQL